MTTPNNSELEKEIDEIFHDPLMAEMAIPRRLPYMKRRVSRLIHTETQRAVEDWWRGRIVPYENINGKDYVPLSWIEEITRFMPTINQSKAKL